MYTYYVFRALRFKIPKWVNISLTTAQILQMVLGVGVNVSAYLIKIRGEECDISYEYLNGSFLIYLTYLILFSNFFYRSYLQSGKNSPRRENSANSYLNGNGHLKEN